MAYKTIVAKACATREIALAELWSQLTAMGWILVDGSCTPVTLPYTDVDATGNTLTYIGHTFVNGQPVQLQTTGTAPGGLAVLTQYYVVNVSGDTFKLATTYNGSAIDITNQGTGNHTITEAYRVYSSNGEAGDRIPEFIQVYFWNSATTIRFQASYGWNISTHGLIGYSGGYGTVTTNQTGFYFWVHGDKNFVFVHTKITTTYYQASFGHPQRILPLLTTFTAPATSGSSVTITVESTAGFEVGYKYQILGASMEGRDTVNIASITNLTQIVITTLPRNYSAGSLIGLQPSTFGNNDNASACHRLTCPANTIGQEAVNQSGSYFQFLFNPGYVNPDGRTNKYWLQPIHWTDEYGQGTTGQRSVGAYLDVNFFYAVGITVEDTFAVTAIGVGTSSGTGNTSEVLNDTTKSWTVNAYTNKVLIITFGTGQGQIKKIASNTATALTLAAGWVFETPPDATSQYMICEEAYRYFYSSTGLYLAAREGI